MDFADDMDEAVDEAAAWGSAAGQQEAGIWTVEGVLAKEERADGTVYLIKWEGWSLQESSWEPIANILTAGAQVRAFEETLAAMPRRDAFSALSPSGCCFGKLCKFAAAGGAAPALQKCGKCGGALHRVCADEAMWLKWIASESDSLWLKCFDCSVLEAQLRATVLPEQVTIYYSQQSDWSSVGPADVSPFTIGAILATKALKLQQICTMTQRARLAPAMGKCKACKKQGGELLACSFCAAVYHPTAECLREAMLAQGALAASSSFPWACPACFKKGVAAVQRAVLKPVGQRAAGARKPRKKKKG